MQQLSQTDIANAALQLLGQSRIQSLTDTTTSQAGNALACNVAWNEAFGSVARATPWNCLKANATLGQAVIPVTWTTYNSDIPSTATTWTPGANYAVNAYVIYAGYLYQCLIANTASTSFQVDLTKGYWFQTNTFSPNFFQLPTGNASPGSGWQYAYTLPSDFIALVRLNGATAWAGWGWGGVGAWGGGGGDSNAQGAPHEIFGRNLYTNLTTANIVYIQYQTDTTVYDALFTEALIYKLALLIATTVRKDDTNVSERLRAEYNRILSEARTKNAGDDRLRRFNPIGSSRFVRARLWSTNG